MAETVLSEEEEKKKRELQKQQANQKAANITNADKNFFEEGKSKEKEAPKLPEPDFGASDKFKNMAKQFEAASYISKPLIWILIPLTIGAFAAGLGVLATVFMTLAFASIVMMYAGGELKDICEDYAIKEEKAAVKKNEGPLKEYYQKCEELENEPKSPNLNLKNVKEIDKEKLRQSALYQASQQAQQPKASAEQSK